MSGAVPKWSRFAGVEPAGEILRTPAAAEGSEFFHNWRGTQVVRERSAKPLCVGSIPTRASNLSFSLQFPTRSKPADPCSHLLLCPEFPLDEEVHARPSCPLCTNCPYPYYLLPDHRLRSG